LAAARRYLAGQESTERGQFDLPGAVLATLGTTGLVFAVIESAQKGWGSATTIEALAVGAALLVALVVNEARAAQPIMPLRLFADRERAGAYLARLLFLAGMIGFFFFTSQYLQDVLSFSPLQAGLAFLPMTAVNFAVAVVVNRIQGRIGMRLTLTAGMAFNVAGMAWLSRIGLHSAYLSAVAPPMVLIGIGQGLAFAPMTSAGIARVDGKDAGAASGLVNTFHQLGSALGLSVVTAIGVAATPGTAAGKAAVADRASAALTGSTGFLAAALVVVVVLVTSRREAAAIPAAAVPDKAGVDGPAHA
ncbi:MAG: MFS transporter, partial [Trebonia sp.]